MPKPTTARRPKLQPPPLIDERQRYSVEESCAILRNSKPSFYELVREGRINTFKDGRRTYVSGAELIRASAPLESSAA